LRRRKEKLKNYTEGVENKMQFLKSNAGKKIIMAISGMLMLAFIIIMRLPQGKVEAETGVCFMK